MLPSLYFSSDGVILVSIDRGLIQRSKQESDGLLLKHVFATSYQPCLPPTDKSNTVLQRLQQFQRAGSVATHDVEVSV